MFDISYALLAVGVILVAAAAHPFVTYPLSLLAIRRLRGGTAGLATDPRPETGKRWRGEARRLSLVFCAYNEEGILPEKLANLADLARRFPDAEFLAYSDGSTDRTNELLQGARPLLMPLIGAERRGKSHGMNKLAALARGDIVVFTDANVILDEDSLGHIRDAFAAPDVGCVCGTLIHHRPKSEKSGGAAVGARYWQFEQWLKGLETSLGSTIAADGGLFAIRRELFRHVPDHIIDDMFTSLSIYLDGWRVVQLDAARGREKATVDFWEELRRKRRIACRCYNCHRLLAAQIWRLGRLRLYCYFSHKLVRWWSGLLLVTGFAFGVTGLLAAGNGVLAAIALLMAALVLAGLRLRHPPLPVRALCTFIAPSIGVIESLRGRSYQIWQPTVSAR